MSITVVGHFARGRVANRTTLVDTEQQAPPKPPRGKRREAARLREYALALRWQRQLDEGVFACQADIAREFGLSRARVTQILNRLLDGPTVGRGR
jgi:hypothetical protein